MMDSLAVKIAMSESFLSAPPIVVRIIIYQTYNFNSLPLVRLCLLPVASAALFCSCSAPFS
jgi:hypothetical protein